jgi:L-seryl-tRNA(Ser) seleniumtransferase
VLRLYRNPDILPQRLAVLQLLTRPESDMQAQAERLMPQVQAALATRGLSLKAQSVKSQIGSGSLPVERLPSVALAIEASSKAHEKNVVRLERLLRASATAVIGRLSEKTLLLDLRCLTLDKEHVFIDHLKAAVERLAA